MKPLVFVRNPGHHPLARSHVGCGNVEPRPEEAPFIEFLSETAGDVLELVEGVFLGVDLQSALGAGVGNVDDCALVGHESGEGFDLLLIGKGSIADSSLGREGVLAMSGPPSGEDFITSLELDPELHFADRVAGSDLAGQPLGQVHGLGGTVEA